jgi:hypothetical protein
MEPVKRTICGCANYMSILKYDWSTLQPMSTGTVKSESEPSKIPEPHTDRDKLAAIADQLHTPWYNTDHSLQTIKMIKNGNRILAENDAMVVFKQPLFLGTGYYVLVKNSDSALKLINIALSSKETLAQFIYYARNNDKFYSSFFDAISNGFDCTYSGLNPFILGTDDCMRYSHPVIKRDGMNGYESMVMDLYDHWNKLLAQ